MNQLTIYGVVIYIVILFILSAFFIKKALNSYEEYSLCGRKLTLLYIIFTYLGTWIGGGTIIGLSTSTYLSGVGQYWIIAVPYFTCFVFAILFLTRIRALNQISIGDMAALRYPAYNEIIRIPVSLGLIIRNVTMVGMQFSALSILITYAFGIDRNLSVLITFLVITAYTALSGLWGVVVTDIFQGTLQTLGLILLLFFTVKLSGGVEQIISFYQSNDQESFLNLMGGDQILNHIVLYFLSFGSFFLMSDQTDWERIYSAKNDKTAFWGYLIPLTITLILLLFPAYLGVFQRVLFNSEMDAEFAVYTFIMELLPSNLGILVLVSICAAIMSSADSYLLATGTIFSNDIVKRFLNQKANDKELIFWTRFFVIIAGAVGFAFALNIKDILYLWIIGIGIGASTLLPSYLAAWFSKRINTIGALSGMAAGGSYCFIWGLGFIPFTVDKIVYGSLMNAFVMILVSLFTKRPDEEDVQKTYFWSPKFRNLRKRLFTKRESVDRS
ncbi:sodium:solute symporter family protein [Sinanaerobacter chloroacetimidivorans]|uniref:Sodium:solute symporter family protein n=1 Tax=Sinanaerobacter chloroacetimidivorans TaxID=2818044 RepID=A0A8J7W5V3_9FIRM|nr:sodium:solute symporter family protein [Sinanaerobacter chloroacetimidivorans]MBR0599893.1 sodium:solute symporter family protein [Sinanaerobacter chloroacetimidivorans]